MKKRFIALLLCCAPALAHAGDPDTSTREYPLFSPARLTIGARAEYSWFNAAGSDLVPNPAKEFEFGVVGAYNLVPKVSAIGGTVYGVDTKLFRSWLGVNVQIYRGPR